MKESIVTKKCKLCEKEFTRDQTSHIYSYCSQKCSNKASAINRRKGYIDKDGYKIIQMDGKKYREHRYVWTKTNGKIPKGYIIHHKNHNKLDNRLKNLQLMIRGEHQRYHLAIENKGAFKKGQIPWNKK